VVLLHIRRCTGLVLHVRHLQNCPSLGCSKMKSGSSDAAAEYSSDGGK
jgi:hypothetical protein